jgi:hypothetical protein
MDKKKIYVLYYFAGGLFILAGLLSWWNARDFARPLFGVAMGLFWIFMGVSSKRKRDRPGG